MTTRQEFLDEVARIYREWEPTAVAGAQPDPQYANNDPSQYPENIVAVSATPEDDQRYWAKVQQALAAYRGGAPVV
jgi:hypothetical protein